MNAELRRAAERPSRAVACGLSSARAQMRSAACSSRERLRRGRRDNLDPGRASLRGMGSVRQLRYSYDDYLAALEVSTLKLEYCGGEIYAMAGGTPEHAELAGSVIRLLGNALLGRCRASSSDLKVRVEATGLSTFADATVVCGPRQSSALDRNAVVNPTLLVEVTSPGTEAYDRFEKLENYKQISSLQGVLLVSHAQRRVTIVERGGNQWTEREVGRGEALQLTLPALRLLVDELYEGILA